MVVSDEHWEQSSENGGSAPDAKLGSRPKEWLLAREQNAKRRDSSPKSAKNLTPILLQKSKIEQP